MLSGGIRVSVTRVEFRQLHSGERKFRNRHSASSICRGTHGAPRRTSGTLYGVAAKGHPAEYNVGVGRTYAQIEEAISENDSHRPS